MAVKFQVSFGILLLSLANCKQRANDASIASAAVSELLEGIFGTYKGDRYSGEGSVACSVQIEDQGSGQIEFRSTGRDGAGSFIAKPGDLVQRIPGQMTLTANHDLGGGLREHIRLEFREDKSLLGIVMLENERTPPFSTPIQRDYGCWRLTKTPAEP